MVAARPRRSTLVKMCPTVAVHGALRDVEIVGDLGVGLPVAHKDRNL